MKFHPLFLLLIWAIPMAIFAQQETPEIIDNQPTGASELELFRYPDLDSPLLESHRKILKGAAINSFRTDGISGQGLRFFDSGGNRTDSGDLFRVFNVRIESPEASLDFDDLLVLDYAFNNNDLNVTLEPAISAFQDLGVYNSGIFIKDVNAPLVLRGANGATINENQVVALSVEKPDATAPFDQPTSWTLELQAGQVPGFIFQSPSSDFLISGYDPGGNLIYFQQFNNTSSSYRVVPPDTGFFAGEYRFEFEPAGDISQFNLLTSFINVNGSVTQDVEAGSLNFSGTFADSRYRYVKYRVSVEAGQAFFSTINGTDIRVSIINERSRLEERFLIRGTNQVDLPFLPLETGDYYVVLENLAFGSFPYSVNFFINNPPAKNFSDAFILD